jgi:hypothetical protein
MLLALALILVVGWLFGFFVFHVTAFAIHILLIVALGALVVHFLRMSNRGRWAAS